MTRAEGKAATRAKVIDASRGVFEKHGFDASDMRTIARAAGVSTGAIFASFKTKGELHREAMGWDHEDLVRAAVKFAREARLPPNMALSLAEGRTSIILDFAAADRLSEMFEAVAALFRAAVPGRRTNG